MVKWSGGAASQWAGLSAFKTLDVVNKGPNAWWWSACSDAIESACGQAETEEQAKACAIAVATALGWVKAEAKPERVMVGEWWEVHMSFPPGHVVRESLAEAQRTKRQTPGFDRIVHVRRYKR